MVAMETSSHVDSGMSYQIVCQIVFRKVTKFGSICFTIRGTVSRYINLKLL